MAIEIDITHLGSLEITPFILGFHSPDARYASWLAARETACLQADKLLLSQEEFEDLRLFAKASKTARPRSVDTWDDQDCNAHFLRLIATDIHGAGGESLEALDWGAGRDYRGYGRLFRGADTRIYYLLEVDSWKAPVNDFQAELAAEPTPRVDAFRGAGEEMLALVRRLEQEGRLLRRALQSAGHAPTCGLECGEPECTCALQILEHI